MVLKAVSRSRSCWLHSHLAGGNFDLPVVGPIFEENVHSFGLGQRLIGTVTVSAPLSRFDRRTAARLEPVVKSQAAVLTRALGGDPGVYRGEKTTARAA